MNNTKWKELITAIKEKIPDIPIKYKTLFEEEALLTLGQWQEMNILNI